MNPFIEFQLFDIASEDKLHMEIKLKANHQEGSNDYDDENA